MPVTITELLARISVDETGLDKGLASADGKLSKFAGNASSAAERIAKAFAPAEAAVSSLAKAAVQAAQDSFDLSGASDTLSRALKGVGTGAGAADAKVAALSGTSASLAAVLSTLEASTAATEAALTSLDEGAGFAQKALSGLGRTAGNILPRLDALSGVVFDPAGIIAGADTATASLDALKAAARGVPGAVRMAGAGTPMFFRGGRGIGEAAGERMTFGGGVRAGFGAAGDLAGGAAGLTTILAAISGKISINFENAIQKVKGNTTMSDADVSSLRAQTLQLMKTGADQQELLDGYKHITNLGYKAADARSMLGVTTKFGIATHTPINETSDVIARFLNDYHAPASMASRFVNTAHFAGAGSNMDIKDLERNSSRTVGLAANYMGPGGFPDVLAAFGALVKNMKPARADTQVSGMLGQIAAPTPKAEKEAAKLGITDFNAQGLRDRNLFGIVGEVRDAIKNLPIKDQAAALKALFNNKQGGIGASFLTGSRYSDYGAALNDPKVGTRAAFAGKTNAIDPLYNQQMQQTAQQFKALSGEIKADFIPLGAKLAPLFTAAIPVVRMFANVLKELLDGFARLPKPVQEAVLAFGAFKILSSLLPMLGGFSLISEKTTVVLGGLARALMGGGAAAEAGAAGIAGMALPLVAVAAGVALLALAWKTDFGHIREVTAKVGAEVMGFVNSQFGQVKAWFLTNLPLIREAVKTVLTFIAEFWKSHGQQIMGIVGPLWSFIKDTVTNALHIIESVVKFILDVVTGHWTAAGKDLVKIVVSLWNELDSLFENGGKLIDSALQFIIGVVLDFGKRLFEGMLNAGQQAINGIVGGIKAGYGQVAAAASGLGQSITGAVHGALDMHSPSRVMFNAGIMAAAGLTLGLAAGTPSAAAAADQMGQAVHSHVRKHLTDAQKQARSLPGDMAKARVTGQFLAAGYSPSAARAAGRYNALGPDAQEEIADQKQANSELQKSVSLWKSFSEKVAGAKAQILDLRKAQRDGAGKQEMTIAGTVARDFPRIPAASRAALTDLLQQGAALKQQVADIAQARTKNEEGLKSLANLSLDWGAKFAEGADKAKTHLEEANLSLAKFIAQYPALAKNPLSSALFDTIRGSASAVDQQDAAKSLGEVNKAVAEMRSKSALELSDVQARIAGLYDPAKAAGDAWVAGNQVLVDKLKAMYADPKDAMPLIGILQGDASAKAAADEKLAGVEKMRQMMADLRKQMLDMSTTDPLAKFKVSMLEMDENGKLALPKGVTDSDLTQTFKLQQQVAAMQKTQEMLGTLKQGLVDSVSGALQGMFSGANSGGGQDWNSLNQELTSLQQQKTSLSQSLLLAPKQIAGTNNLTVITEAKQTTKASLDAVDKQIADTKKKMGGFHRDALTMFTGFFQSVTRGFTGMLNKMGMELIQSMLMKSLTKMIGGSLGGLLGGGGGGLLGGGGGGLLGSITGIAGPLLGSLGGNSSGGMITSGQFSVPGVSIQGMGLGRRAFGGPAFAGSSYIVGDGGEPEVFTPGESGHITPLSRAGGGDVHVHMTITTPDANSFRASQGQIMSDAFSAGQRHKQRSGR